jgi:hypothetical protein
MLIDLCIGLADVAGNTVMLEQADELGGLKGQPVPPHEP